MVGRYVRDRPLIEKRGYKRQKNRVVKSVFLFWAINLILLRGGVYVYLLYQTKALTE